MWWLIIVIPVIITIIYYKSFLSDIIKILISYLRLSRNPETTIIFEENHVHITYYSGRVPHNIKIPHNPSHRFRFHKMVLIKELSDGVMQEIDITHQHGIPYFLTAAQMGGTKIIKRVAGEDVNEFGPDEIPKI